MNFLVLRHQLDHAIICDHVTNEGVQSHHFGSESQLMAFWHNMKITHMRII